MSRKLIIFLMLGVSTPAMAQRTTNNAVTASDDAFGRAVGSERIGIYSIENVRGFDPIEAGNARIEGLYFDQQAQPSSRLIDSSAIRVGYAAQGYPFPSPTGIADLKLEQFEGKQVVSFEVEKEDRANIGGSVQVKLPIIGEKLGLSLGIGARSASIPQGRFGHFNTQAATLTWNPYSGAEVIAFWSRFGGTRLRPQPTIFPIDGLVPAEIDRDVDRGQPWAQGRNVGFTTGTVVKLPLGAFRLEAGLFQSKRIEALAFSDLLQGARFDGSVARHNIIADADNRIRSTSGEVRLTRVWQKGAWRHTVIASVRGRNQSRIFGGEQVIRLGPTEIANPALGAQPAFSFGPSDTSTVKQITPGFGYQVQWAKHGALNLAIQKTDYRKDTRFGSGAPPSAARDRPWLFSANGTANIAPGLTGYAGYVQGLEESPLAPTIATNRSEAPPAARTSQRDAGIRYAISPKLSLIAGVFELRKTYYNLDTTQQFRELGVVRNRGVEISLAGTLMPGLNIVAGALFLDPQLELGTGITGLGKRPVGTFRARSIANFDWRPQGQTAWSFDLALDRTSATTANQLNTFKSSPRQTVGFGARYRFALGKTKLLLRGQVQNAFSNYGWKVSSSGGFTYTLPRTAVLSLAGDF